MIETRSGFRSALQALLDELGLGARSDRVDIDGLSGRTHVFETGPTDSSIPLLFIHGTAGFGAILAPLMAELRDVRGIAVDRPGYGLSDPFRYTEDNLSETLERVIEGVLDHVGVAQADVVGHSMGGYAALRFARSRPARVRRLVLLGAVPALPGTRAPLPLRLMTAPVVGTLMQRLQRSGEKGVMDIARVFGERAAIVEHPALIRAIAAHEDDPESHAAGDGSSTAGCIGRIAEFFGPHSLELASDALTLICDDVDRIRDVPWMEGLDGVIASNRVARPIDDPLPTIELLPQVLKAWAGASPY